MLPAGVDHWPIPTPFPVGDVNAWYLPGAHPALIDPGPDTPAARAALDAHLDHATIEWILFTHHHVDHAGLAAYVKERTGARVACQKDEAEVLARWGSHALEREKDYEAGLIRAGVPEEHRERMRYGGRRIDTYGHTVHADRALADGDELALGDHRFRVLHVPGHTSGSMVLQEAAHRFSFSGDTLLARITPNALSVRASERSALPDYLATLRRLRGERLGTILPGHGPIFDDAASVIDAALRHADVRQDRIVRLLQERPGTAYEVARRLFLRLPDDQVFLAVSETLGHLSALARAGKVRVDPDGPADRYAASAHL